jgi:hypothetical protein
MSEDQKLQNLSSKLQDTVDRIDKLQQKPTFRARVGRHLRLQSNSIIHAMLAGCIFTVALGRLSQKNKFQVRRTCCLQKSDKGEWAMGILNRALKQNKGRA